MYDWQKTDSDGDLDHDVNPGIVKRFLALWSCGIGANFFQW